MKLDHPFLQLPLQFDAERLAYEINSIEASAWQPHPQGFKGNDAITLIAPYGKKSDDELSGPMRPTEYLKRCTYLSEVLETIGGVWGRSRLMRLSGQAEVKLHVDVHYYWRERMRVHVPIITQPSVRFYCGDQDINMAAGQCWIFDTWRRHRVVNDNSQSRVHLVADTIGGEQFWTWFRQAKPAHLKLPDWHVKNISKSDSDHVGKKLRFETSNVPNVMTPWEMREHFSFLFGEAAPHPHLGEVANFTFGFCTSWQALWTEYGDDSAAYPVYRELRDKYLFEIAPYTDIFLQNGYGFVAALGQALVLFCVKDESLNRFEELRVSGQEKSPNTDGVKKSIGKTEEAAPHSVIEKPIVIVSAPRSGSTMLFEALSKNDNLYTIGGESHQLIESHAELHPASRNYDSNVLGAEECNDKIFSKLRADFYAAAHRQDGSKAIGDAAIRLLEKTPKNALRIPFLNKLFVDATYIFLYRDPKHVISSMIDAWQSGRFKTYPQLPGWSGMPWSLLLVPGWRDLVGKPLHYVVAYQWATTMKILLDDLHSDPLTNILKVRYETFVARPQEEMSRINRAVGLRQAGDGSIALPLSRYTLTAPDAEKWKRNERLISESWHLVEEQAHRLDDFMKDVG